MLLEKNLLSLVRGLLPYNLDKNFVKKYIHDLQVRYYKFLPEEHWKKIIESYNNGLITREAIEKIIEEWNGDVEGLISKYKKLDEEEVKKIIEQMLKDGKSKKEIFRALRGKADLKLVAKILQGK